eukprot:6381630-Amphidinium_carterae.1
MVSNVSDGKASTSSMLCLQPCMQLLLQAKPSPVPNSVCLAVNGSDRYAPIRWQLSHDRWEDLLECTAELKWHTIVTIIITALITNSKDIKA